MDIIQIPAQQLLQCTHLQDEKKYIINRQLYQFQLNQSIKKKSLKNALENVIEKWHPLCWHPNVLHHGTELNTYTNGANISLYC